MQFFEGSEKKVEVVVNPKAKSLLSFDKGFWENIVKKCNATILSTISNEKITAYLLSESSLFVTQDRFLMITCGETILINSIIEFIKEVDHQLIDLIIFQRKNEYKSHLQKSSFQDDIQKLREIVPGKAFRMGDLDGHHNYIFHSDKPYHPTANDNTSELLMYHISGVAAKILRTENTKAEVIRDFIGLEKLLPNFQFDDFSFEPFGYSLNAVYEDHYLTIHITPQEDNSYVSFETNLNLKELNFDLLEHILGVFSPRTFDHIGFNSNYDLMNKDYLIIKQSEIDLSCGYQMTFSHFSKENDVITRPVAIL